MIPVTEAFATSYAAARSKFLQAAKSAQLPVHSFVHPQKGAEGEDLAMDVVFQGEPQAERLLILSNASQGADGFAGSAVQTFLLHDQEWQEKARTQGVAVLYVHAINPWGMSHWRFGDHENINFLRNFVDFTQELPSNAGYAQMHEQTLYPHWQVEHDLDDTSAKIVEQYGLSSLLSIFQRGQYTHPDGFYYGGTHPAWAQTQWREILRKWGQQAKRIAWVDMRRGWGVSSGMATRIANVPADAKDAVARAQKWWAINEHQETVLAPDAPQTIFAAGFGSPIISFAQECPQAEFTGLAAYFAVSESLQEVSQAGRSAHWLSAQAQPSQADKDRVEALMRNISYKDEPTWQGPVISQGRQIAFQAVNGLSASDA